MRVAVYKNLVKGCWSIAETNASNGRGKLIGHADRVALGDVVMVVRESRRQHVIKAKCREVHAWCVGTLLDASSFGFGVEVTYNPYRCGSFTTRDGRAVSHAEMVVFSDKAIAVGAVR